MLSADSRGIDKPLAVIYADSLYNRGGTGVYTRRLLSGFCRCGADVIAAVGGKLMTPSEALAGGKSGSAVLKVLREAIILPRLAASALPSIVHLPAFSGRAPGGVPCALTLHDLAFCSNPSWFPIMRSLYYRMHFRRAAHRADVIMVDSEFTRREAIRLLGVKSSRIRRVYLSSECIEEDPAGFREYFGLRGRYVVYAGTVEPRKNVSGLLKAWSFVLDKHPDCTLVIAGRWGWGTSELKKAISTSSGVFWTGEIPRILLNSCITGAELLVYPSFYEGFGLPPLEAASAGTPSVVSPADALVEIYSDISRVAADHEPTSIAEAILESLDMDHSGERLKEFASHFTIDRMAGEVLEVYREHSK